jgi:O-methyltransferase involved in polyketide biosynthesis
LNISKTALAISLKFNALRKQQHIQHLIPYEIHQYYESVIFWHSNSGFFSPIKDLFINTLLRIDEMLLPGDLHHIIFRKLSVYTLTKAYLKRNPNGQIVVLGSGFDHLAWIFANQHPCFELDVLPVIRQKQAMIKQKKERLYFIEWDANNDRLIETLNSCKLYNSQIPTLFITEGLIDYLDRNVIRNLAASIKTLNPKNEWLSTHFDREQLAFNHRISFELGVRLAGEKLTKNVDTTEFAKLCSSKSFHIKHKIYSNDRVIYKTNGQPMSHMKGCSVLHLN